LWWQWPRVSPPLRLPSSVRINANTIYTALLTGTETGSAKLTRRMMTGNLRDYLFYILAFTALVLIVGLVRVGFGGFTGRWPPLSPVRRRELAADTANNDAHESYDEDEGGEG